MVLDADPQPVPGIATREAVTLADYLVAERVKRAAFGNADDDAAARTRASRLLADERESGRSATFLALLDGRPVGTARVVLCDAGAVFSGGCVLGPARGHGCYRALVAARVAFARERGARAVVSQAGAQSRPILARLGFREVLRVRVLLDDAIGET